MMEEFEDLHQLDALDELIQCLSLTFPSEQHLDELYDKFITDLVTNPLIFEGKQVRVEMRPSKDHHFRRYAHTFVHIITKGGKGNQRRYDGMRANRLHWIRVIIENYKDPRVMYWQKYEDGYLVHLFLLPSKSHLVVLKAIDPDLMLITSYDLDKYRLVSLTQEYNALKQ